MDISSILPIGTVVLLKDGEKRLMITGIKQIDSESGKEFDYVGVFYPEGHIGEDYQFLFNQGDIQDISFRGFEDDERTLFIDRLKTLYENS